MSQYSVLDNNDINEICRYYDISKVNSFSVLSGGSENTNYFISAENKQYVLTICEQKTKQSALELGYLLEHLAKNKFETSKLVRTNDHEAVIVWNGKPVMLKLFLEGKVIQDLPIPILETIGIEIGRLHQIEPPSYLPKKLSYGKEFFHEVSQYDSGSNFEEWLRQMTAYFQPFISEKLPKSLIHSDIFSSNIVVNENGNNACIMDFEEASNYYRVFDLGMTLVGLCCDQVNLSQDKARALLNGYRTEVELLDVEKRSLQAFTVYAATSMTFWRHRNFNHVNPNQEMYNHHLGLKAIADFVRNIPQKEFMEILN